MLVPSKMKSDEYWTCSRAVEPLFKFLGMRKKLDLLRINKDIRAKTESWFRRNQRQLIIIQEPGWWVLEKYSPSRTLTVPKGCEELLRKLLLLLPNITSLKIDAHYAQKPFFGIIMRLSHLLKSISHLEFHFTVTNSSKDMDALQGYMMEQLPNLKQVTFYSDLQPGGVVWSQIMRHAPRLESIAINLLQTGKKRPHLKQFITELSAVAGQNLKRISFKAPEESACLISQTAFQLILEHFPNLVRLELSSLYAAYDLFGRRGDNSVGALTKAILECHCDALNSINLGGLHLPSGRSATSALNDYRLIIDAIATRWPHLEHCRLPGHIDIKYVGKVKLLLPLFRHVLQTFGHVPAFKLSKLSLLQHATINFPQESKLFIGAKWFRCPEILVDDVDQLGIILSEMPSRDQIALQLSLDCKGFWRLAHHKDSGIPLCHDTTELRLLFLFLESENPWIQDIVMPQADEVLFTAIDRLLSSFPNLKSFDLVKWPTVFAHRHHIERFCSILSSRCKRIRHLKIMNPSTNGPFLPLTLADLKGYWPHLKRLSIRTFNETAESVEHFIKSSPNLVCLQLRNHNLKVPHEKSKILKAIEGRRISNPDLYPFASVIL